MIRFRTLATLAFSSFLLVAQEPVMLAQNFEWRFQQWQVNQTNSSTSQATYDFTVGLPVFTYRLGALALTGALTYDRLTAHDETYRTEAAFGVSSAGARLNLFPYQPFKVRLDFTRTRTPGLLGAEPFRGDIFGAGIGYRGRYVKDVDLSFRKSILRQGDRKETWSTLDLHGNQRFGITEVNFQGLRQDFAASTYIPAWRNTHAILRTETVFSPTWRFRTTESMERFQDSRWLDGDATLQGYAGAWTNLTTLGYRGTQSGSFHTHSESLGESLAWKHERWILAGTAAISRIQDNLDRSAQNASFITTLNTKLGTGWNAVGSVATSSRSGSLLSGPGAKNSTSFQVGLIRGGDLPDQLRHSLFLVSDWSFDRWRNEVYPPGYLPGELADQLVQRRLRQQGRLDFSMDLGRTVERGGQGSQDWARMSGNLSAGPNLRMLVLGDWRRDDGFTLPGMRTTNTAFTSNASYALGRVSLTATLGLTKNRQEGVATDALQPSPDLSQGLAFGTTRFEAVGFNMRMGKVPMGVLWTRLDPGFGPKSQALSAHVDLDYRLISFRITYDEGHQQGGLHTRRVMVTLHRFFDTVAIW